MKKKVLFIIPYFSIADISKDIQTNYYYLQVYLERNFDITILTHNQSGPLYHPFGKKYPSYEEVGEYKIVRLKNNFVKNFLIALLKVLVQTSEKYNFTKLIPPYLVSYSKMYIGPQFIGLKKYLKKNTFDTVFVAPMPYEFNLYFVELKNLLNLKCKVISKPSFHEEKDVYYQKFFKKFYDGCDYILANSSAEKDIIEQEFKQKSEKVLLIHNFLNISEFAKTEDIEEETQKFKKENNLNNKVTILGICYPLPNVKGFEYTIQALRNLSDKYDNLALIIISGKANLKEFGDLSRLKILNLGYVDTNFKDIVFNSCDIFCMPTQSDSFGFTFLEAWLRKKPIISFDTKAQVSLFSEGGLFAKKRDIKDLEDKLEILIKNEILRKELGEKGYKKLINSYSKEAVSKYLEKIT